MEVQLSWIRTMKESIDKEPSPKSVEQAEATLKRHTERKTEMDGRDGAFSTTASHGEQLGSSLPPILRAGLEHRLCIFAKVTLFLFSYQGNAYK